MSVFAFFKPSSLSKSASLSVSLCLSLFADDRFILKQIKSIEISAFEDFAPRYLDYVTKALENKVRGQRGWMDGWVGGWVGGCSEGCCWREWWVDMLQGEEREGGNSEGESKRERHRDI